MAGLILVGHCIQSLPFYDGLHEVPEQGLKGMICRAFSPCLESGEVFR